MIECAPFHSDKCRNFDFDCKIVPPRGRRGRQSWFRHIQAALGEDIRVQYWPNAFAEPEIMLESEKK